MKKNGIIAVLFVAFHAYMEAESIYPHIAGQYLSSLSSSDFEAPLPPENTDVPELEPLNNAQKCMTAFKVLGQGDQPHHFSHAVIDHQVWNNLELFSQANLLNRLKRTSTKLGEATLARILADPITNTRELTRRQSIIRTLIDNEALFQTLDLALKTMQEAEGVFLSFWNEDSQLNQEVFRRLYFPEWFKGSSRLNNSSFFLNILRRTEDFANLLMLPATLFYIHHHIREKTHIKIKQEFYQTINRQPHPQGEEKSQFSSGLSLGFHFVDFSGSIVGPFISAYQIATYYLFTQRTLKYIHAKMAHLANAVSCMHMIHDVTTVHKTALKDLYECHALNDMFQKPENNSAALDELLNKLETRTFKHDFHYYSNVGKILASFKLMNAVKQELIPALKVVGIIDAYMSIARLMREFEGQHANFCFVEFQQTKRPYLRMDNFWYPIVEVEKVVLNSLELGKTIGPYNMIITGQNTGGKSTILKATATNLILAQSFGIAAASFCNLTPFTSINTYMNVTDNAKEGQSLFAAEVNRAKSLLSRIMSLQPHEKSFAAIDEAFKGTGGEAQALSYWYALKIGKFVNSMCINATHYQKLTALEEETNGIYKNYKVEVKVEEDGRLTRPYRLEEGYTLYNIAQYILEEQGLL